MNTSFIFEMVFTVLTVISFITVIYTYRKSAQALIEDSMLGYLMGISPAAGLRQMNSFGWHSDYHWQFIANVIGIAFVTWMGWYIFLTVTAILYVASIVYLAFLCKKVANTTANKRVNNALAQ